MIIAFRNFLRNKMVNLSALSIRHFIPDAEIYCFTFYKTSLEEDYSNQEKLLPFIKEVAFRTKYIGSRNIHDHIDPTKTSGYANQDNAKYFTEGYNLIQDRFKNKDTKLLILAEDHFFTTGAVLKELIENDWHVAYASAFTKEANANASILGINPARVNHLFPLVEKSSRVVEAEITEQLIRKIKNRSKVYQIKNRKWIDYCGDGLYTNSSEIIEQEMKKAGIL